MSFNKKIIDQRESQDWKEVSSVPLPSPSIKNVEFSHTSKLKLINQERPDINIQEKSEPKKESPAPQKTSSKIDLKKAKKHSWLQKLKKQSIHYNQILSQKTKEIQNEEKAKYHLKLEGLKKKYQHHLLRLKGLIEETSQKNEKKVHQLNLQKQAEKLYLEESHKEALDQAHQKNKSSIKKLAEAHQKKTDYFHSENKKKLRALRKEAKAHHIKGLFWQKKISNLINENNALDQSIKQIKAQLRLKTKRAGQMEADFKKTLSKIKYDHEAQIHSLQLLNKAQNANRQPDISEIKASYEIKIRKAEAEAQKEAVKNFKAKIHALKLQHTEELKKIKEDQSRKKLKQNYEQELAASQSKHHSETVQLNSEHRLQTELLKKNYDAEIHHLKSEFFSQIQNIKSQSEASLNRSSEIQQKLESQLASLESQNKTISEQLEKLKEEKETQDLKTAQTEESHKTLLSQFNFLESQNKDLKTQLEKIKQESLPYKEQLQSAEKTLEKVKAGLSTQFHQEKVEIRNQSETSIQKMQLEFHKEKLSWIEQSEKLERHLTKTYEEEKNQIIKDFTDSITALKTDQNSLIEKIKSDHQKNIKEVCYDLKETIEDNKEKYEERIAAMQKETSSRIAEIKTTHEKNLSSLSRELEQALLDEKKKNTELIELYDRDTVQIQKELISLQSKFKSQEQDFSKLSAENKTLNQRAKTLISENKNFKDQNEALQLLSDSLRKELEEKIERIASLQKLNQHISQSLFKAKKTKPPADKTKKQKKTQTHDLVSALHLY